MDYQTYIQQLPERYENWGTDAVQPKSDRFQAVLNQVQGMTTTSILQLLNAAVDCMEPNEVYCEVGSFQGATLIGALLDHSGRMAYAVDNFSEFDPSGENLSKFAKNITTFGLNDQVFLCEQDFEAFFLDLRSLQTQDKIGVYLYDGAHDYRSQLMGLLLAKPFLADRALIVVDDSNWLAVKQANWDFITTHPQCRLLLDLQTPGNGQPSFWNGIQVLSWDVNASADPDWHYGNIPREVPLIRAIYDLQNTIL
jgi:protein O-GlcNAc transferase